MSNSGGGPDRCRASMIMAILSNSDVAPLLAVDPADVTNRIYSYTDQHFAAFDIVRGCAFGQRCRCHQDRCVAHPDRVHGAWRLRGTGRRPEGRVT